MRGTARLGVDQGRLRARLYEIGRVSSETLLDEGGWELEVEMDKNAYEKLHREEHLELLNDDDDAAGIRAARGNGFMSWKRIGRGQEPVGPSRR